MVEIAIASLPSIEATLNYVAATGEKLVSYAYEPPLGFRCPMFRSKDT
jgi:hypothetical protein